MGCLPTPVLNTILLKGLLKPIGIYPLTPA